MGQEGFCLLQGHSIVIFTGGGRQVGSGVAQSGALHGVEDLGHSQNTDHHDHQVNAGGQLQNTEGQARRGKALIQADATEEEAQTAAQQALDH